MQRLYRICRKTYRPWDPGGAVQFPGRWHSLGQAVLYFSSSLALAVLEARANGADFGALRTAYHYAFIEVDLESVAPEMISERYFGSGWAREPQTTRHIGSNWFIERRSCLLGVRSAALSVEHNFIANTAHPDFGRLKFSDPGAIPLDPRI